LQAEANQEVDCGGCQQDGGVKPGETGEEEEVGQQ